MNTITNGTQYTEHKAIVTHDKNIVNYTWVLKHYCKALNCVFFKKNLPVK